MPEMGFDGAVYACIEKRHVANDDLLYEYNARFEEEHGLGERTIQESYRFLDLDVSRQAFETRIKVLNGLASANVKKWKPWAVALARLNEKDNLLAQLKSCQEQIGFKIIDSFAAASGALPVYLSAASKIACYLPGNRQKYPIYDRHLRYLLTQYLDEKKPRFNQEWIENNFGLPDLSHASFTSIDNPYLTFTKLVDLFIDEYQLKSAVGHYGKLDKALWTLGKELLIPKIKTHKGEET